jgi:hypothetical protein
MHMGGFVLSVYAFRIASHCWDGVDGVWRVCLVLVGDRRAHLGGGTSFRLMASCVDQRYPLHGREACSAALPVHLFAPNIVVIPR